MTEILYDNFKFTVVVSKDLIVKLHRQKAEVK